MRSHGIALFAAAALLAVSSPAATESRSLEVRLLTHLTSYRSKAGTPFQAVVVTPYLSEGQVRIPRGAIVHGKVRRANSVGLGLRRERAQMELEFIEYQLADGRKFPIRAKLKDVDNAREEVLADGRIRGVLAADAPHKLQNGFWHRPRLALFERSLNGLSGLGGWISKRSSCSHVGNVIIFAARCALFRMPEPEIHLPPGAEFKLAVSAISPDAPSFAPAPPAPVSAELADQLRAQPHGTAKPNRRAADIINIAVLGGREEVLQAFTNAGWAKAEPLTPRTFSRAFRAFTTFRAYPTAPVSTLLYRGKAPDFAVQKSLNTIAKRHHLRLWQADIPGGPKDLWLGAATHDTGIEFDSMRMTFTHRINRAVDAERKKVVTDLRFAGCADPVGYVDRPELARALEQGAGTRKGVISDGRIAVISVRSCQPLVYDTEAPPLRLPASARLSRRVVLEARNYLLRGSVYYLGYKAVKWKLQASRELERESDIEE